LEKRKPHADRGVAVETGLFKTDDLAVEVDLLELGASIFDAEIVVVQKDAILGPGTLVLSYLECPANRGWHA
jgi:hypothetical protein